MGSVFAACVFRRITNGWGYSAMEDVIVFVVIAALSATFAVAGYVLSRRPPDPPPAG